jgi:hypothetical protein
MFEMVTSIPAVSCKYFSVTFKPSIPSAETSGAHNVCLQNRFFHSSTDGAKPCQGWQYTLIATQLLLTKLACIPQERRRKHLDRSNQE